jgi:PIN domain nuclease of toxin-antitoxin system
MILLDSQTALWVLDDSPRLGGRARALISGSVAVHVSVASVWELTIKAMLGKIEIPAGLAARLVDQGLTVLDVTAVHAEGIRDFPELLKHDPFDRLIVAQAAAEALRLVTADRVLLGLGRDFLVDAGV